MFSNRFLSGGFVRRIFSFLIPVSIFCAVLYGLLFLFNKKEESKKADLLQTNEQIDPGKPELLPHYREWAQFPPLSKTRSIKTLGKQVIYDAVYEVDHRTLRINPKFPRGRVKSHFIFSGCSMTFGIAVNGDESIPAYYKSMNPEVDVVNFAFGGGGPNLLLRPLDFFKLSDLTDQAEGKMVYVFINDHLNRWFARPAYMEWAPDDYAHYTVKNGKVVFEGKLRDQKFYKDFQDLKKLNLQKSYIKASAGLSPVNVWTDEEVHEFFLGVKALKDKYLASFKKGKFAFYFHPTHGSSPELYRQIKNEAEKLKIEVIDSEPDFINYMNIHNLKTGSLNIEHDGHGKPEMNKFIATWFSENF